MKPFASQSYYELLEISVSASTAEVRAAWERLNRMYADDQVALYGLTSSSTAAALRKRLREAMDVLADDQLRAVYDEEIGLPARESRLEESAANQIEMGELLRGADRSLASTHPRVAFTWSPSPSAPTPVSSPPLSQGTIPPVVTAPPAVPAPVSAPPVSVPPVSATPWGAPLVTAAPVVAPPLPVPSRPSAPLPSAPRRGEAERISEEAAISMLPRASAPPPRPAPSAPDRPKHPELTPDTEYNGEVLRKVRAALGLSLLELAERTRIGSKHLENVEADRYDALPTTVYLRGILMSVAKELRLDGLKVARSYLSLVERIRSKG